MKNKIIGILIILIGILLPIINTIKENNTETKYIAEVQQKLEENNYFAILEIPNINLKRELFWNSLENDVNKNIWIHEKSTFPDNGKSNIILASHSGNGRHAYFKYLYKLKIGDIIKLYYQNKEYEYEIKEIENQKKNGTLYLKQEYKQMITLITCTYQNSNLQTIYYAKLIKVD